MDSVIQFEKAVALREEGKITEAEEILDTIRNYNKLDCESTMKLDRWLRQFSANPIPASYGIPAIADVSELSSQVDSHHSLIEALENGLPSSPEERNSQDRARALLAAALQYHPRERRPAWWKLFELIKAELSELELGWGGSPVIGGSPQGVSSKIDSSHVIKIVTRNLV
jgi:uncharacterized protein